MGKALVLLLLLFYKALALFQILNKSLKLRVINYK